MMNQQMQIYVRLFPIANRDWQYLKVTEDLKDIYIKSSVHSKIDYTEGSTVEKYVKFHTSGVLANVNQEELYRCISQDIFPKFLNGLNIIIMVNGQHDSGKSFTMTGYDGFYENRGLSLRLIEEFFYEMEIMKNKFKFDIHISYVDFAAKTMTDLLTEPASNLSNINHAVKQRIKLKEQLVKAVMLGEKRRWVENSTSHCASSVLTIYLKCTSKIKSEAFDYYSRLQLVELSGVESVGSGKSLSCQSKANTDMTSMSLYLASKNNAGITRCPSKLVSFLAETWKNSFIRVISHLIPSPERHNQNMSTLLFTSRLMQQRLCSIKIQRIDNEVNAIHCALEMIRKLEEELLVREMIIGEGFKHKSTVGQVEMDLILTACNDFLSGHLTIESLLSTAHPHIIIRALKQKFEMRGLQDSASIPGNRERPSVTTQNAFAKSERLPRLSGSKKKLGPIKKIKQPIDETSSHILEEFIEPKHSDIPDRHTLEAEFFTRYPEAKIQLDLASDNYETTLRIRDGVFKEYERLKKLASEGKKLEEDEMWKKRFDAAVDDCVGFENYGDWVSLAENPAQEAATAARKEAADALNAFTNARDAFYELRILTEEKIQHYIETAYGIASPTLDNEDMKTHCFGRNEVITQQPLMANDLKMKIFYYKMKQLQKKCNPLTKPQHWAR